MLAFITSTDSESEITTGGNPLAIQNGRNRSNGLGIYLREPVRSYSQGKRINRSGAGVVQVHARP